MKPLIIGMLIVAAGLLLLVWVGLKIQSLPFPAYAAPAADLTTTPLPKGLPAPVERFYLQVYGENIPIIDSAVITGRGKLRVKGITFPARFQFIHRTGRDYRHYIETTIWGQPVMKVNEHFLDGVSKLELPFGVSDGPNVDQGANLALWAEAIWMPSVWVTDPQARWEPRDANSAVLVVPFGETEERITVQFDPQTGLVSHLESMRFKESASPEKILWMNDVLTWDSLNGYLLPVDTSVTWLDEGTPWAHFTIEDIVYNSDINDDIRLNGLSE